MHQLRICCVVWPSLALIACGNSKLQLPEALVKQAEVVGGSTARMRGDELPNNSFVEEQILSAIRRGELDQADREFRY